MTQLTKIWKSDVQIGKFLLSEHFFHTFGQILDLIYKWGVWILEKGEEKEKVVILIDCASYTCSKRQSRCSLSKRFH